MVSVTSPAPAPLPPSSAMHGPDDGPAGGLLERARALAPLILQCAERIESERELPPELVEAIAAAGLFRMLVPGVLGGPEADLVTMIGAIEEMARADGSTGWVVATAATIGWHAARVAPDELAWRVFGDPRAAWANGPGKGRAEIVREGLRVTGRWTYGSGSRHATWFLVGGCPVYEDGAPRLGADGKPEMRVLWVPAEAVEVLDTWEATGLRGTSTNDWAVNGAVVPDDAVTARPEPRSAGPLYRVPHRAIQSLAIASVGLGIARGALDAFAHLAREKTPFSTKARLCESEAVQVRLGEAEAALRAGRAFMLEAARALWDEVAGAERASMERRVLVRVATTHAIGSAVGAVDAVYHAAGATAMRAECPLERRFRDVHGVQQHLQGRTDHYRSAGQWALGVELGSGWL